MEIAHEGDVDLASRAHWQRVCRETTQAIQDHCMSYVTPVSHAISDEEGELKGTGAYIEFAGHRLLITNEHVLRDWRKKQFTHQLLGSEDVFRLKAPLAFQRHPVDAAVCGIPDVVWKSVEHRTGVVPSSRLAVRHDPMPGELLFVCGFPQERSRFLFGQLTSRATRLLTQAPPPVPIEDLHDNYFLIAYAPERTRSLDTHGGIPLSAPPGMSGSLVWNTRRVECLSKGVEWEPGFAQVTGMVCRWDSSLSMLQAVRIEVIREFLGRHIAMA